MRAARGPHRAGSGRLAYLLARAHDDELGSCGPAIVRLDKELCPGCVAARAADSCNRWPIGDCGPECARRAARLGSAAEVRRRRNGT